MKHINKFNESNSPIGEQMNELTHRSYYWVLLKGYNQPIPCFFQKDRYNAADSCFLPGGIGDSSSMGIYADEITKIGPEIEMPNL